MQKRTATNPHALELFRTYRDGRDRSARDRLIAEHMPLVRALAHRYAGRGEPFEDLVQVGSVGLIKAVDRFDPGRSVEFTAYAIPTILGEIGHYLRDCRTTVRVPSRLRELRARLLRVIEELTQTLGRSPRMSELAAAAKVDEETVIEALESERVTAAPLEEADTSELGADETAYGEYEIQENRLALRAGIGVLDRRERWIVYLHFFEGLNQSEIADGLGISQMHVSRLLARAIETMRSQIVSDA
jgi:RNA polymerase sigma-B factor